MMEHYLPFAGSRCSAKTFERFEEIARLRLIPAFGDIELRALNAAEIQQTYIRWLESGRKGEALSARTVVHYHRLLYRSMKYALRKGFVARNVVEDVDPPKPRKAATMALDEVQTTLLLDALAGTSVELPVLVAIYSGLRRGELCALRWQDIDFDKRCITVRQAVEQTKTGVHFKEPKTIKGNRIVMLARTVTDRLREHKQCLAKSCRDTGKAWDDSHLVFPDPIACDGSVWKPNALTKAFEWRMKQLHLPHARLHDLRHTHATLLLKSGILDKTVSDRLGHSSTTFTKDTYGHVIGKMDEEAAEMIDTLLQDARC